jgi:serine/threonine protein kinase
MGEVYRARDAKLGRDIALKVLPDSFAADPDRLAHFHREALGDHAYRALPNVGRKRARVSAGPVEVNPNENRDRRDFSCFIVAHLYVTDSQPQCRTSQPE